MFKEENRIWWYLLGTVIMMFALLVFGRDYFIPIITGRRPLFVDQPYVYYSPPAYQLSDNKNYYAKLVTDRGTIEVDLLEDRAPKNVNNFVFLANEDYYNGTLFHRLIDGFLIQGGDRNSLDDDPYNDGLGGPGYTIKDEVNWDSLDLSEDKREELRSKGYESAPNLESAHLRRFVLAMASNGPNSIGSQFFFVTARNSDQRLDDLNGYFTVIGRVTKGSDVLLDLADTPINQDEYPYPRPEVDLVIKDISIFTK